MAKINFKRCETISDLSNIDIVDGNFIVTGDGKTYIDYGNERKGIGGTPDLDMDDTSANTVQNSVIKRYVDNIIPKGVISVFAGSVAPNGWLICDGSAISRSTYSDLFNVIGTTYGTGNGDTTFNLPDLKGKIPVGYDISDSDFNAIGKTGGEKTHTLTINEIPSHSHTFTGVNDGTSVVSQSGRYPARIYQDKKENWPGLASNNTGGGQSHNIMQPYITMNYIIKY